MDLNQATITRSGWEHTTARSQGQDFYKETTEANSFSNFSALTGVDFGLLR